jgi:hypothetical protein
MKKIFFIGAISFVIVLFNWQVAIAQVSNLVSVGTDGRLVYQADAKGNVVPDYSGVGYKNSEAPIPTVGVVKTVYPVSGDNLLNVQTAINEVAAMPLASNGFRGTILFKAGTYNISDTIIISASGIVLRGEGTSTSGTIFNATKASKHALFYFAGALKPSKSSSSIRAITDAYVPIGAKQISVAAGHNFTVGNTVYLHRVPNQAWIDMLTMTQWGWLPSSYDIYYDRKVTGVNGNTITLDAPAVDVIDPLYATGELLKYTERRIENCAIENMRITSNYASETDNNHGWEAVVFENIFNGWAKNIDAYYFGLSAVHVEVNASFITVDSCKMFDGKSTLAGGERYSFNVDGQRTLIQNCFTRNGRHDFVNGSQTAGPNVFYNCQATSQLADIGPHHRWSTGILFDNIVGDGAFAIQNRTNSGTGHGWAGAQTMFWNCTGDRLVLQDPQGDHRNWAVGYRGWITGAGDLVTEPVGIVESLGTPIAATPSLFKAQLQQRLNGVVPITLLSFTASPQRNTVVLIWSTSNELNNKKFIIEHSNNGAVFKEIGQIIGNRNSIVTSSYTFTHAQPQKGLNYYRLKQIDLDNSFTYSPIQTAVIKVNTFQIQPSLVTDELKIQVDNNEVVTLKIYNGIAQLLKTIITTQNYSLNVSSYATGMYVIKSSSGEIHKFYKQ